MAKFLQGVLAVFAGSLVAVAAMAVCETMGHAIFPPPADFDPSRPGAIEAYVKGMRSVEFVPVLLGWAAASLMGASVAARLAPRWKLGHGLIVGALFLAAGVGNMVMIPHPAWVWAGGLVIFPVMSFIGATLGSLGAADRPKFVEEPR